MISQACIDPSAGRGHKLVHWVWHTHVFHFPHSIWFDFDHFRRLATCVTNTVPLNESRPSRLFGLIISRNMTCISRPPFIAYHYSLLCLTQELSLILALRWIWYSSSPSTKQSHCGYECTWNLNTKQGIHSHFAFLPAVFPVFGSTRGRVAARQNGIFHQNTNTHSAIQAGLWSDEHFRAISLLLENFLNEKEHMKKKMNHLLFVSSGGMPLWNCICLLPSSSTSLNSPCWIQCLNR